MNSLANSFFPIPVPVNDKVLNKSFKLCCGFILLGEYTKKFKKRKFNIALGPFN